MKRPVNLLWLKAAYPPPFKLHHMNRTRSQGGGISPTHQAAILSPCPSVQLHPCCVSGRSRCPHTLGVVLRPAGRTHTQLEALLGVARGACLGCRALRTVMGGVSGEFGQRHWTPPQWCAGTAPMEPAGLTELLRCPGCVPCTDPEPF